MKTNVWWVDFYVIMKIEERIKVGLSPSQKVALLADLKPFNNDEKCFLLHLKNSFPSHDNEVLVTTFWSCRNNSLIRKIRLTSKFMTSQPGLQTIAIYMLSNISQSKGNQTTKFGQLIE